MTTLKSIEARLSVTAATLVLPELAEQVKKSEFVIHNHTNILKRLAAEQNVYQQIFNLLASNNMRPSLFEYDQGPAFGTQNCVFEVKGEQSTMMGLLSDTYKVKFRPDKNYEGGPSFNCRNSPLAGLNTMATLRVYRDKHHSYVSISSVFVKAKAMGL